MTLSNVDMNVCSNSNLPCLQICMILPSLPAPVTVMTVKAPDLLVCCLALLWNDHQWQ